MLPEYGSQMIFLLGDPLKQSIAAKVYNSWFRDNSKNIFYFPIEIHSVENLETVLESARILPFAGLGITKPFKVKIMGHLDEADAVTRGIGSVNTIVIRNGKWIGYNTDGIGALKGFRKTGFDPLGKNVFCYGAGGTGRSVCFHLAQAGAKHIYITSRSISAHSLSNDINRLFPEIASAIPYERSDEVIATARMCDMVMNLTGVGMGKSEGLSPANPSAFSPGQFCFDAVYSPIQTQFLVDAKKCGAEIQNGFAMFVGQAAGQLDLWCECGDTTDEVQRILDGVLERTHDYK